MVEAFAFTVKKKTNVSVKTKEFLLNNRLPTVLASGNAVHLVVIIKTYISCAKLET